VRYPATWVGGAQSRIAGRPLTARPGVYEGRGQSAPRKIWGGREELRLDLTTVRDAADGIDPGAAAIPKHLNVVRGKSFKAITFNRQGCWPLTPSHSTSNQ
jgi:hypothetical protein